MQRLDLKTAWKLILSHWRLAVICMVIGAVILGVSAEFLMTEKYTSGVCMYVSNITNAAEKELVATYSNLTSSERLVLTYIDVLQHPSTLERALPLLGNEFSVGELSGMVSVRGVEDTAIMYISVTTDDPVKAARVCNAVASIAPEALQNVEPGSVKVIGEAQKGSKSFPDIPQMTLFGLLGGLAIAVAFVLLRHLLDNTVKTETALKDRLGVTVLGVIPEFINEAKEGK